MSYNPISCLNTRNLTAPRVSIGMPIYNGAKYLSEALESMLSQVYRDFEIVISDNGSEDATQAICCDFASRDSRIRYYRQSENIGAARNYNFVFAQSKGELFKWASHDDICLPHFLTACVNIFDHSPDTVVLTYPQATFIDADGDYIGDDTDVLETRHPQACVRLAHILSNVSMANAIFGLIRSEALAKTRLIDSFIASDYVLLGELAMLGEFAEVEQSLFRRRIHQQGSQYANTTEEERLAWFAPEKELRQTVLQRWFPHLVAKLRLVREWCLSAGRLPLPVSQRMACWVVIPTVYPFSRFRCFLGRLRIRFTRACQKSPWIY